MKLAKLQAERGVLAGGIPEVVVTQSTGRVITRILPRGDFLNERERSSNRPFPAFLGKLDTGGRRATRLDLANWLVSQSESSDGESLRQPSCGASSSARGSRRCSKISARKESGRRNPELLDWMAAEFMHPEYDAAGTHDWDVRHMVRPSSPAILQARVRSVLAQMEERDPDNRLLAHQNRFRVEAEIVHDIALSVSGLLVEEFGGPSVHPYEPAGYLAGLNFPKREYSASHGDDLYRRGLYTKWQRTFLHPSLFAFDAPTREECTVNRTTSNTPLQALVLLNDPIYVEASRVFAENIVQQGGATFDRRLNWAFERAVNSDAHAPGTRILTDLYRQNLSLFQKAPDNAKQLIAVGESPLPEQMKPVEMAAMTTIARAILNMHETITRN